MQRALLRPPAISFEGQQQGPRHHGRDTPMALGELFERVSDVVAVDRADRGVIDALQRLHEGQHLPLTTRPLIAAAALSIRLAEPAPARAATQRRRRPSSSVNGGGRAST